MERIWNGIKVAFWVFIILLYILSETDALDVIAESGKNPFDYARITALDYTAKLVDEPGSNGKVIITERITYDIHSAFKNNPFFELWRDMPEDTIDGLKYEYKVNSVYQVLDDGTRVPYTPSRKLYWDDSDYTSTRNGYGPYKWYHSKGPYNNYNKYECLFFYIDGIYRDEIVFEIEYEMTNAALRYRDCSELYLVPFDDSSIKYLESFNGTILIPEDKMPMEGNYEAYTYGTNSKSFYFSESYTLNPGYHTFSFSLDKSDLKFKPHNQYLEFSLIEYGEDKHSFTQYAPMNAYSRDNVLQEYRDVHEKYYSDYNDALLIKLLLFLIFAIWSGYLILSSKKIYEKIKQKHLLYEPTLEMGACTTIPSDLDPYFASTLVFCKDIKPKEVEDMYGAIMLSLIYKKYIELVKIDEMKDWVFENINVIIKYKPKVTSFPSSIFEQTNPINENSFGIDGNVINYSLDSFETKDNAVTTNENIFTPDGTISGEEETYVPLTQSEETYFNLIVRLADGDSITLRLLKYKVASDYEYTTTFAENFENSIINTGIDKGYFQKSKYTEIRDILNTRANFDLVIGILLMTIGNLIIYNTRLDLAFGSLFLFGIALIVRSYSIKKDASKCILLTQLGEDEYVKWRSLYNYLNDENLIKDTDISDIHQWEQYLIYATAFGIANKISNVLNIKVPYDAQASILSNRYYTSATYRNHFRSFRSIVRRVSSYSSYGGYGGGGRGGHGGGGGH